MVLPGGGSTITSLLPLDAKLKKKYTLFQVNHWQMVEFRSGEIEEYIPLRQPPTSGSGTASTDIVQPSEVNMVRHFLKTVCPPDVYAKFAFDAFLAAKLKPRGDDEHIHRDPSNAHARMALACLRVQLDGARQIQGEDSPGASRDSACRRRRQAEMRDPHPSCIPTRPSGC